MLRVGQKNGEVFSFKHIEWKKLTKLSDLRKIQHDI